MDKKTAADIVIQNVAQLLTCKPDAADHIGLVTKGSVALSNGKITAVGREEDVAPFIGKETKILDASGKVVMPGFVDCHTHVDQRLKHNHDGKSDGQECTKGTRTSCGNADSAI